MPARPPAPTPFCAGARRWRARAWTNPRDGARPPGTDDRRGPGPAIRQFRRHSPGLALSVVLSHAFSVATGAPGAEPLVRSTGFSLGEHAVNGFFAVSGFLVTMSYDRRGPRDYALARALRIVPGFVAATLAVALLLGPALTRLPVLDYLASPALWRFVGATLTGFKSTATLPGVFEANPFTFAMGTVWTLKYEILCYAGVLGLSGLLRSRAFALALVTGLALAVAALDLLAPDASKGVQTALRLPLLFAAGGALYLWRDRVRLSGFAVAAALVATILLRDSFAYRALLFLAEAYAVIWLALAPGLINPMLDPRADLSYGTYLYGWPIQQSLVQLWPDASPLALLGPSLGLTLAVAALSWFLIEKPALGLKARLVRRPALSPIAPATP
jgi:peptidoglycan/LPS O-acetylase OafA/YrhL